MSKHPKVFTYNSEKKRRVKAERRHVQRMNYMKNHPESPLAKLWRGEIDVIAAG